MKSALAVSTTVSSSKTNAISQTANQVSQATVGSIQVNVSQTRDPNPIPGDNEATSTTHEDASSQGCPGDGGRTIHVFVSNASPGRYRSSRAIQPGAQTPNAYAHDAVGHGVVGLCHVDGNLIGGLMVVDECGTGGVLWRHRERPKQLRHRGDPGDLLGRARRGGEAFGPVGRGSHQPVVPWTFSSRAILSDVSLREILPVTHPKCRDATALAIRDRPIGSLLKIALRTRFVCVLSAWW